MPTDSTGDGCITTLEACDTCMALGKTEIAVATLTPVSPEPSDRTFGLCQKHLDAWESGGWESKTTDGRVQCRSCEKTALNERAMQSHITKYPKAERDAQRPGVAISAVRE